MHRSSSTNTLACFLHGKNAGRNRAIGVRPQVAVWRRVTYVSLLIYKNDAFEFGLRFNSERLQDGGLNCSPGMKA